MSENVRANIHVTIQYSHVHVSDEGNMATRDPG